MSQIEELKKIFGEEDLPSLLLTIARVFKLNCKLLGTTIYCYDKKRELWVPCFLKNEIIYCYDKESGRWEEYAFL